MELFNSLLNGLGVFFSKTMYAKIKLSQTASK